MNFVPNRVQDGGRRIFPFSAILGQADMKLAFILNAVNPAIGGVVVRGQKGTAKSTAARGLSSLLPALSAERRPPFVDLPLGATEDMVIGSIDFETAIRAGEVHFQPGLLARANEGVLYIDEVNLLDDHLVDAILDAAESGENIVEREGQSLRHASRFILIGTMNPEEGELRPQLLDRFGLAVAIEGESDPKVRVDLLKRREEFDRDPDAFILGHRAEEAELARRIHQARRRLGEVACASHLVSFIAEICERNHVAGHRADIVLERSARAHAAWLGRGDVIADDILAVAPMVLLHRMRSATADIPPPPSPPPPDEQQDGEQDQQEEDTSDNPNDPGSMEDMPSPSANDVDDDRGTNNDGPPPATSSRDDGAPDQRGQDEVQEIGTTFSVRRLATRKLDQVLRTGSGRRARTRSASKQGRYVKSTARRDRNDLALDATIRAAAPYQQVRRGRASHQLAIHIAESDIREKIRERRVGNFLLFVVDGSGSMGVQRRMVETKAAIMSLLLDAYQKRDKVAMIVFRGREAVTVLPPTGSVDRAAKLLADLPIGGRTPLVHGLGEAAKVLGQVSRKDPTTMQLVIVMTDGRANFGLGTAPPHEEAFRAAAGLHERFPAAQFIVVDTEAPGVVRLELARKLAAALGAAYFNTDELRAEDLVCLAKEHQAW